MQAILQFELPDEQEEFDLAVNSRKYGYVVSEMNQYLRRRLKHEELSDEVYDAIKTTQDKLIEILLEYNLDIE